MKKIFLMISLAAMVAFVSCQKENEKEKENKMELTIKASIATTKTTVTSSGISWAQGDAIVVSCDGEAYNFSTTQSGATDRKSVV